MIEVDGLPQDFVKIVLPVIGPSARDVFNKLLLTTTFLNYWKQSLIIALNKFPSPKGVSDFHPTYQLCFLSKVLEKLVFD